FIPELDGEVVTTAGRVTTGAMSQDEGFQDFYIQSAGAGLSIVVPDTVALPAPGDSVVVTGTVAHEAGMVMLIADSLRVVPGPPRLPEPAEPDGWTAADLEPY